MKIALLTSSNPQDRRAWSGTIYHIARALQKHCGEVSCIGPLAAPLEMLLGKCLHRGSQLLLKKNLLYRHCFTVAQRYASVAGPRLADRQFDVIIAPNAATEIAFLRTSVPIVLVEDANFIVLHEYHQHLSNLLKRSIREAEALQAMAIKRARLLLYPTEWAARAAIHHYHADAQNVRVVPFGANLEVPPPREMIARRVRTDCCRLLLVGVNWQRKGGDIAREALFKLKELGVPAELIVCGCKPPRHLLHKDIHVIPFLDKNDALQRAMLEHLYINADFFLLPTRNECYGIAFCEANAFGLPVITTDTGGVSGVITNGVNGYMLPRDANGAIYARLIASIYQDTLRYEALARSSRAAFEQHLNWDHWGGQVKSLLRAL